MPNPSSSGINLVPAKAASLAPWFPPHLQRNIYLSLLHLEPEDGGEKVPKVPDSVLRAALLRRAVEDINRIIQVRAAKQSCGTLLQRGSVGDDLWQRLLRAEKEMEEELRDVVMEVRHSGVPLNIYGLTFTRQTHLHRIGARPYSNPRTKLLRILCCVIGLMKSKRKPRQKRSGGRSEEHRFKQI